jgi:hypothetical protein
MPEGNLLAGLDLDGFARGRIAAHTRRALSELEDAEPVDANARRFFQVLAETADHVRQHGVDLTLRQLVGFGQGCRQIPSKVIVSAVGALLSASSAPSLKSTPSLIARTRIGIQNVRN